MANLREMEELADSFMHESFCHSATDSFMGQLSAMSRGGGSMPLARNDFMDPHKKQKSSLSSKPFLFLTSISELLQKCERCCCVKASGMLDMNIG